MLVTLGLKLILHMFGMLSQVFNGIERGVHLTNLLIILSLLALLVVKLNKYIAIDFWLIIPGVMFIILTSYNNVVREYEGELQVVTLFTGTINSIVVWILINLCLPSSTLKHFSIFLS